MPGNQHTTLNSFDLVACGSTSQMNLVLYNLGTFLCVLPDILLYSGKVELLLITLLTLQLRHCFRYSDFQINEVDIGGNIICLTTQDVPDDPEEIPGQSAVFRGFEVVSYC